MTDDELRDALLILTQRATRNGSMDPLWDLVFELEALLLGRPTLVSRGLIIKEVEQALKR